MNRRNEFIGIIFKFRKQCLNRYNFIDVLEAKERDENLGHKLDEKLISAYRAYNMQTVSMSIVELIDTIRLLKLILRKVKITWDLLYGEIDFDEVLVSTVLRYAAPEAYGYLLNNYSLIRRLGHRSTSSESGEIKKIVESEWSQIVKTVSWDIKSTEQLIQYLFPDWGTDSFTHRRVTLQGVSYGNPTDYWIRLNNGVLADEELSDQVVLRSIIEWKENRDVECYNHLKMENAICLHNEYASKIEHFGEHFFRYKEVLEIASKFFDLMTDMHGRSATKEKSDGFSSLWRLAIDIADDRELHERWVTGEIAKIQRTSFRLSNDVYHYWGNFSSSEVNSQGTIINKNIRKKMLESAKSLYLNEPGMLARVIDPEFIYSLYHFVNLYGEKNVEKVGSDWKEWGWFVDLIVDLAKKEPDIILPQISTFFINQKRTFDKYIYEYDDNFPKIFFSDKFNTVIGMLAKGFKYEELDSQQANYCKHAIEAAKTIVSKESMI